MDINNRVNILCTIDKKYIKPMITMISSYKLKHLNTGTHLYIAHSGLDDNDFAYIEKECGGGGIYIHNVYISERYFSHIPLLERIPEESFYRLLAFHYLPQSVEKCLYLDPDIIINKSLYPLFDMDIEGRYIAAAGHMHGVSEIANKKRLRLKDQERYLNSGVMLMNLKKIREDFTLEIILSCIEKNMQKLIMGDQDVCNILFGSNMILLDERVYNLDERTYKYYKKTTGYCLNDVKRDAAIIHYNGKYKPWLDGYKGELDVFYPNVEHLGDKPKGVLKKQIKSIINIIKPKKNQMPYVTGCLLLLLLCTLSYVLFGNEIFEIIKEPDRFRMWLDNFGMFDELFFVLLRSCQTVVKFLPAEPFEIGAGYAWGTFNGMLYCLIGNIIGSIVILYITKKHGVKVAERLFPGIYKTIVEKFNGSDKVYFLIFILYLIPGTPKDGFTYIVGLLDVKVLPFMLITSVARIPSIISSTLCGSTLAEKQPELSLLIFGITAIIALAGALGYKAYFKNTDEKNEKA